MAARPIAIMATVDSDEDSIIWMAMDYSLAVMIISWIILLCEPYSHTVIIIAVLL